MTDDTASDEHPIRLSDLIAVSDLDNTKVRLVTPTEGFEPVSLIRQNPEALTEALLWNYPRQALQIRVGMTLIGLVRISGDRWLLFDVCRVTKDLGVRGGQGFEKESILEFEKYRGRVIVQYRNPRNGQLMVRWAKALLPAMTVLEILPARFDHTPFPGYRFVRKSFPELKHLIENDIEWQDRLKQRKGVYLIRDRSNGKQYVGSAYGRNGIYGRWHAYVTSGYDRDEEAGVSGTYPNKGLKRVFDDNGGIAYLQQNFEYALLETFPNDDEITIETVVGRENWWKETLGTRTPNGYNHN